MSLRRELTLYTKMCMRLSKETGSRTPSRTDHNKSTLSLTLLRQQKETNKLPDTISLEKRWKASKMFSSPKCRMSRLRFLRLSTMRKRKLSTKLRKSKNTRH